MANVKLKYQGLKKRTYIWQANGKQWALRGVNPDDVVSIDASQAAYLKGNGSFISVADSTPVNRYVDTQYTSAETLNTAVSEDLGNVDSSLDDKLEASDIIFDIAKILNSSANELVLDLNYNVNTHLLTEDTELQIPDMSTWPENAMKRWDLYIVNDSGGSFSFTISSAFLTAGGTDVEPTTGAGKIDRYVIDCNKTANMCLIGLAQADIS